ncbi:hypothetical protein CBS147332_3157 [Penicillium roqueforti]|nr:hypothetical protein CBS147332_3157 [Penicillium roqueforti]KAI3125579.1 hypothetical protein CBS147331_573 [Penicillium roqueforti]
MTRRAATLPLLRGNTTLESALEQEEDVFLDLDYPEQRIDFFVLLYSNRDDIERIASYHLGLGPSDTCRTGDVKEWAHGSFNVCIPLYENSTPPAMWMRNCAVKLQLLFGYIRIVRKYPFLDCGGLDLLEVKVLQNRRISLSELDFSGL